MSEKQAAIVNYQTRALEFSVGDCIRPFLRSTESNIGRVVAVWPAIGMVDVEWPHGNNRMPVEEIVKCDPNFMKPPVTENVPGGAGTMPVAKIASRVAQAYVKKALYWVNADRMFRATKTELDSGAFTCPKCKNAALKRAIYKRKNGMSERLLGCPACLFLIKRDAILNHPEE